MSGTTEPSATTGARAPGSSIRRAEPRNAYVPFAPESLLWPISRCFEEQVRRHGGRTAVKDGRREFRYDALNRAANRAAHCLLAQRSRATEPVAVFAEQGASAIIALLAALKAGRPYVPLDPTSPRERIEYLLRDAQASAILASGSCLSQARELGGNALPVIDVDDPGSGFADEDPRLSLTSGDIAAIVYTSGSTGQPKGVMCAHGSMVRVAAQATADFHICAEDRIALVVPYGSAAGFTPILGALLNGAMLLPFNFRAEGFTCLADWLRQEEITIFRWVPTAFRRFAQTLKNGETFPKVRLLYLGGETILRQDFDLYKRHFHKDCLLRVGMAMTEANGAIARVLVDQTTKIVGDVMPVGYAVEGTGIVLLDEEGNEVESDCIGEITLKSAHLSPGYWRRPDLTARAFQLAPEGGVRLYRTGDLGRKSADGCLWHLGRKDFQVKIRGLRVELAEVEAALLRLPGIGEAAAVACQDAAGSQRIVAYLVARESPALTISRMRSALAAALPAYMIPARFVFLDALPLAPSGKLDRSMLPSPGQFRPRLDGVCRAPRTATEARLAHIWEEILDVRPVGVTDNFFELGGDSLAMAALFAAVEEEFGRSLPPTDLFKAPTVEGLAHLLEDMPVGAEEASVLAFRTTGAHPPLFCVDNQNAGIFVHLAHRLGPEQPCYGIHAFGYVGTEITIESLAAHYVRRVRAVQPDGPYYLCGMCSGGKTAYEMAQQLLAAGQSVAWLALFDPVIRRRSVLPWMMQRMMRRWEGRGERHAQRRVRESRVSASVNRQWLRLERYVHRNRRVWSLAMARYHPKPYPGRLHIFLAEHTRITEARDSRLAWRNLARDGAETFSVPGVHEGMLDEPHVAILAEHVRRHLEAARHEAS